MLIFEKSRPGKIGYSLAKIEECFYKQKDVIPGHLLAEDLPLLPELSEPEVVRHYVELSRKNFGVDVGFYPLGSCTMKYNPKVNEEIAQLDGFSLLHPYQPESSVQGALEAIYTLEQCLKEITGMSRFTFQPAAGAQGELVGLLLVKAYFNDRGDKGRQKVLIPDSAHGTNPASASMSGFEVVKIPSNEKGGVSLLSLSENLDNRVACLMLTNPNTLGLFDENILTIASMVHKVGALLYYDGANANATLGITRPAELGFDIVHLNLHKTFSTPHGGGGPGAGPIGVVESLVQYLPVPLVDKDSEGNFFFNFNLPKSIGKVRSFWGNFLVLLKSLCYILQMGAEGLRRVSEDAILNANYLMHHLKKYYYLPFPRICQHEFVLSARWQKEKNGVKALDIAKRLMDFGFHPPTIYFPLIVEEAIMIEPTETESRQTLDKFIEVMGTIANEAEKNPQILLTAPHNTPVKRLDEVKAARQPVLKFECKGGK